MFPGKNARARRMLSAFCRLDQWRSGFLPQPAVFLRRSTFAKYHCRGQRMLQMEKIYRVKCLRRGCKNEESHTIGTVHLLWLSL